MDSLPEWVKYGLAAAVIGFFIYVIVKVKMQEKQYTNEQIQSGADKRKMLDVMSEVMGNRYPEFFYVLGWYEKVEHFTNKTRTWYYSYILAFNSSEMVLFPFIVKDGKILLRNRMDIDWKDITLSYHLYREDVNLDFDLAGEKISMYIRNMIKSSGEENSSTPLAVSQKDEVERLKNYLPGYAGVKKV